MSKDTLRDKANQIGRGLADKPELLIEVFRHLYQSDPPVKVTSSWSRRDHHYIRYNLLSAGEEVGVLFETGGGRWEWIAQTSAGRINGETPNAQIAAKAVDHFLMEDDWTLASPIGAEAMKDVRNEEEDDSEDQKPERGGNAYQNPQEEESEDDIPF